MAGVTDRPFRQLCKRFGAGYAISEMVASNPRLRDTEKSLLRTDHRGEVAPIAVQIAGADPTQMAEAARYNGERGAQIIDINMGCPAKKVCNVAAGSALLGNETLVAAILETVVRAVDVPVTLKIRTGRDISNRNALVIARIAERAGVQALAVHGRTRACGFVGPVEYDTIRAVKQVVAIPVIANGDIASPELERSATRLTRRRRRMRNSARSTVFSRRSPAKASASTTAHLVPRSSMRVLRSRVRHSNRNGVGRPWPREKDTTDQRQQRARQDGREIAR